MHPDNKTAKQASTNGPLSKEDFNALAIARIKSLLDNPDTSKSQKKTLLNILHKLERQGA